VSALSGERGGAIGDGQPWPGALAVAAGGPVGADGSADVGRAGRPAGGEAAKDGEDAHGEGEPALKGRFFSSPAIFMGFLYVWLLWSVMPAQAGIQALCPVSCGISGFPLSRE